MSGVSQQESAITQVPPHLLLPQVRTLNGLGWSPPTARADGCGGVLQITETEGAGPTVGGVLGVVPLVHFWGLIFVVAELLTSSAWVLVGREVLVGAGHTVVHFR